MAQRNLWRQRFNLLPTQPFALVPKKTKNPHLLALFLFMKNDFNLKHVNRIEYAFDPFHESTKSIRNCMFYTSGKKVRASNPKCVIRSNIVTDRSDPMVRVELANGQHLVYNTCNLTELEVLKHLQKTKSALDQDPEDSITNTAKK